MTSHDSTTSGLFGSVQQNARCKGATGILEHAKTRKTSLLLTSTVFNSLTTRVTIIDTNDIETTIAQIMANSKGAPQHKMIIRKGILMRVSAFQPYTYEQS